MRENADQRTVEEWFLQFVIAAFAGWLYEVLITYLAHGQYEDRGILHLPLCPIYGFGMLLLAVVLKNVKNGIAVFLYGAVITTAIELAASYVLEYGFHTVLWSYEDWPFHFQTRISLFSSLIFGAFGVLFIKIFLPCIHRACIRADRKLLRVIMGLFALACLLVEVGAEQGMLQFPFPI